MFEKKKLKTFLQFYFWMDVDISVILSRALAIYKIMKRDTCTLECVLLLLTMPTIE